MTAKSIVPPEFESVYRKWRMSPGLECNGFVFLTGFTGTKPDGSISLDTKTQVRDTFQNIESVLQHGGLDFGNVVELTSYHIDIQQHLSVFRSVHAEFVVEPYPAWTAIEVSGLIEQNAFVEVRVIARR
jgi:enamine deaminase RidA (YjgF/YER057c/UK114 family)